MGRTANPLIAHPIGSKKLPTRQRCVGAAVSMFLTGNTSPENEMSPRSTMTCAAGADPITWDAEAYAPLFHLSKLRAPV